MVYKQVIFRDSFFIMHYRLIHQKIDQINFFISFVFNISSSKEKTQLKLETVELLDING